MIKITRDLQPKNKYYRITHTNCCEFVCSGDEFKWSYSPYNERYANVKCPKCGKQFYGDATEMDYEEFKRVTNTPDAFVNDTKDNILKHIQKLKLSYEDQKCTGSFYEFALKNW